MCFVLFCYDILWIMYTQFSSVDLIVYLTAIQIKNLLETINYIKVFGIKITLKIRAAR